MREFQELLANRWAFLLIGYVVTIAIETPILCLSLSSEHPLSRRLLSGLWLTACTYPLVVLVIPEFLDPAEERPMYLAVAESVAHFGECALFYLAFRPLKEPVRDLAAVFGANLASFGLGELLHFVMAQFGES